MTSCDRAKPIAQLIYCLDQVKDAKNEERNCAAQRHCVMSVSHLKISSS